MAEETNEQASGCGEWAERDEEIEAEDGGRKDKRKGDGCLRDGFECGVAAWGRDPAGERQGEQQQQESRAESEAEGEPEGLRVHGQLQVAGCSLLVE